MTKVGVAHRNLDPSPTSFSIHPNTFEGRGGETVESATGKPCSPWRSSNPDLAWTGFGITMHESWSGLLKARGRGGIQGGGCPGSCVSCRFLSHLLPSSSTSPASDTQRLPPNVRGVSPPSARPCQSMGLAHRHKPGTMLSALTKPLSGVSVTPFYR